MINWEVTVHLSTGGGSVYILPSKYDSVDALMNALITKDTRVLIFTEPDGSCTAYMMDAIAKITFKKLEDKANGSDIYGTA